MLISPEEFFGVILPVGMGNARKPSGHSPVIKPRYKIIPVRRPEGPQCVFVIYPNLHPPNMKAVTRHRNNRAVTIMQC
jgi:hypothetical protein